MSTAGNRNDFRQTDFNERLGKDVGEQLGAFLWHHVAGVMGSYWPGLIVDRSGVWGSTVFGFAKTGGSWLTRIRLPASPAKADKHKDSRRKRRLHGNSVREALMVKKA